jgi:hypothetical protein
VLDQLLAELGAVARVFERGFERRARDAQRLRGDADPASLQVGKRDGEPLAARSQQVVLGDRAVRRARWRTCRKP